VRRIAAFVMLAALSLAAAGTVAQAEQNPNCPRGTDQVGNKCIRR